MMRSDLKSWKELQHVADKLTPSELRAAQQENQNDSDLKVTLDGFTADFRSSVISHDVKDLLLKLCEECTLEQCREEFFSGAQINNTEERAVMHMALRANADDQYHVAGENVVPNLLNIRTNFLDFAENVRNGTWCGSTGEVITDVVNIGIGGSDLGPNMVCEGLKAYASKINIHFVSNVDAAHIEDILRPLLPEKTLFIIASKTFTTQETLLNAQTAKRWISKALGTAQSTVTKHFVAVSTNEKAVAEFGIDPKNMFPFWNWVCGRFSLWSSIGLSIAMQIGRERFLELLDGARAMDQHFASAPLAQNIPVLAGAFGMFYRSFLSYSGLAILPYAQRLNLLPSFLQQLEMESNGKCVTRDGVAIDYQTCPMIFGQTGTNGQHAFYQMLHQGTDITPCDFMSIENVETDVGHHKILGAHLSAQMEALREGQDYNAALERYNGDVLKAKHSIFDGGRPCHLYQMPVLSPYYLGMLIAMYEHKVFVQGVLWDLNSFDQWGVQLGKDLSKKYI